MGTWRTLINTYGKAQNHYAEKLWICLMMRSKQGDRIEKFWPVETTEP